MYERSKNGLTRQTAKRRQGLEVTKGISIRCQVGGKSPRVSTVLQVIILILIIIFRLGYLTVRRSWRRSNQVRFGVNNREACIMHQDPIVCSVVVLSVRVFYKALHSCPWIPGRHIS